MSYKQFIYCWQKRLTHTLVGIAARIIVTICLTMGMLSILISAAPISHAQAGIFPTDVAINIQLATSINHIREQQTLVKATVPNVTVYRSPDCNCCQGWVKHLKEQGFEIKDFSIPDVEAIKEKYNVPNYLTSCHTAIVDKYVIEGHVPADDIKRLLQQQTNVAGLSVPQMPVGTPGMEIGNQKDPFTVFSFDSQGRVAVFNRYPSS